MIYHKTPVGAIIAKIKRDTKMRVETADAIEWIKEAIDFIGVDIGMEEKSADLSIIDYRTTFPVDLFTLDSVYYEGNRLRYGIQPTAYGDETLGVYLSAKTEVLEHTNTEVTRYGSRLVDASAIDEYYYVDPGYVKTSFETGDITINYKAYPVDHDGMLEVPDTVYYREALKWYVVMKTLEGGASHPVFKWDTAVIRWNKYCASAANDAMFPTIDRLERSFNH